MYNDEILKARNKLIFIIAIFGTVGVVSHFIPMHSSSIVFYRALFGGLFIIFSCLLSKKTIHIDIMKENLLLLSLTGIAMSLNWVLLFEAFRVSSVSIGTVTYNTMPIFVIIISPLFFKNIISLKNIICIILAAFGVFLVSNVNINDLSNGMNINDILGIIYGLLGALFYAIVVILNKKLNHIETYDKIIFQFMFSAVVMLIYIMCSKDGSLSFNEDISSKSVIVGIIALLLLAFFHTGFCYIEYFDACLKVSPDLIAILTYIDPLVALILSNIILKEHLNIMQKIGAIIILISTIIANN